jgi:hypothetical protein
MVVVSAMGLGHAPGEDAGGVPHDQEVGAVASGLGAVKVDEGNWWIVSVGVVVQDGEAGGDRAAGRSPRGVVCVELGAVGGDMTL